MRHELDRAALLLISSVASACLIAPVADAQPSQIILLRHAEKATSHKLCATGQRRADALAAQYLGKGATNSLFAPGQAPAAFLGVTPHSLETVTPAAETWGLPVVDYSIASGDKDKESDDAKEEQLGRRTQEAAHDIMTKPEFNGKLVVVSWEHRHIANRKLEQDTTLRQQLGLANLHDVPDTWPGDNYDYFWIVDYTTGKSTPSSFRMVKETFAKPYDDLPQNDWGDKIRSAKDEDDCKD